MVVLTAVIMVANPNIVRLLYLRAGSGDLNNNIFNHTSVEFS